MNVRKALLVTAAATLTVIAASQAHAQGGWYAINMMDMTCEPLSQIAPMAPTPKLLYGMLHMLDPSVRIKTHQDADGNTDSVMYTMNNGKIGAFVFKNLAMCRIFITLAQKENILPDLNKLP